ncbi:MAG TPA: 6-phosphogluconolactonase [Candidatus Saccharimonadia bacterium]|nr:6-phosphogluconolactonase [Candidatus Saccharimonadia bacterium]
MQVLREKQDKAIHAIATRICKDLLAGKRVLWLVSGGSNVNAEVGIMQLVSKRAGSMLKGLAILPMDERYGLKGHKDSNSEQLRAAGFDPGEATWVDVLIHDLSFEQTVSFYGEVASTALSNATSIIGQFGLGSDAHTAGILPGSPATEATEAAVIGYEWSDYERMTLTPAALAKVQVGYVLAYGKGKEKALSRLQKNTEPAAKLPAKILYDIPEVYVYNDASNGKG